MSPSRARAEQCRHLARRRSASADSVTLGKLSVAYGVAGFLCGLCLGCGHGFRCLGHFIDHALEIVHARNGNDDRAAFGSRFLRDAQETATGIFLERDGDELALDLKLGGFEGVFLDEGPGRLGIAIVLIRPATVGRWTFV